MSQCLCFPSVYVEAQLPQNCNPDIVRSKNQAVMPVARGKHPSSKPVPRRRRRDSARREIQCSLICALSLAVHTPNRAVNNSAATLLDQLIIVIFAQKRLIQPLVATVNPPFAAASSGFCRTSRYRDLPTRWRDCRCAASVRRFSDGCAVTGVLDAAAS